MYAQAKNRIISFENFVETKVNQPLEEGSIVCFYHANDYLGKGKIVRKVHNQATVELDSLAKANFTIYSYRLFEFMILDDEVELLYDEY
jgi:hypothetical protein